MQKIAEQNQQAGQTREYDNVPSIQRIQLRNSSEAKAYVSLRICDAVFDAYERGNKTARIDVGSA